jgi:hypothetical protein
VKKVITDVPGLPGINWIIDDGLEPNKMYVDDTGTMVFNGPMRTAEYKDSRMPGIYECINCGFRSYDTHAFYFVQHATFEAMCIPCNNKREKNVRVLLEDYDVAMSR